MHYWHSRLLLKVAIVFFAIIVCHLKENKKKPAKSIKKQSEFLLVSVTKSNPCEEEEPKREKNDVME